MSTDDERRAVAARLRSLRMTAPCVTSLGHGYLWSLLWAVSGEELGESNRCDWFERMCSRLADLIEPGEPTGRGVDSIYDWCWERLEGADGAEDELYCSIMRAIEDYRHQERASAHTVRAVDRDALLALAEEMDAYSGHFSTGLQECTVQAWAVAIREALGVES